MIFKVLITAATIVCFASPSKAAEFGLQDPEEARQFREEAREIATRNLMTRGPMTRGGGINRDENLDEFKILQKAYRVDPKATMDLIRRILEAGQTN